MKIAKYILISLSLSVGCLLSYAQLISDQHQINFLRRLQLDNRYNPSKSFLERTMLIEHDSFPAEAIMYSVADPIKFKKNDSSIKLGVLPLYHWSVYNTHYPITINDGEFVPSAGYQSMFSSGISARKNNWVLQIKPSLVFAENKDFETFQTNHADVTWRDYYQWVNRIDLPERFGYKPLTKVFAGQSFLRYNFSKINLGISTENLWWGPGYYQSLMMTNNAPGFLHFNFQSDKPIQTSFGSFEFQAISGKLQNSGYSPIEPRRVYDGQFLYQTRGNLTRIITGGMLSIQPKVIPGLFMGFSKVAYMYLNDAKSPFDFMPLFGMYGWNLTGAEKGNKKKMMGSMFFRYFMKNEKAEAYAEFGRNDKTMNPLFLLGSEPQPTGFVAGFRKLISLRKKSNLEFGIEFTQLGFNDRNLIRDVRSWYLDDTIRHGYTNRGEVIGSGLGPGGNSQLFEAAWNNGMNRISLQVERRIHNNDFYYYTFERIKDFRRHWTDLITTLRIDRQYKNFLYGGSITAMRTLNYQWWYIEYEPVVSGFTYFRNGLDFLTLQGQLYLHYRFNLK
jgi:Capsule assembly protein Wzi